MTPSQLYVLYCRVYQAFDRGRSGAWPLDGRPLSAIEAAVAEFAEEDAANGRPIRTGAQFERSVAAGTGALGPLGLRA